MGKQRFHIIAASNFWSFFISILLTIVISYSSIGRLYSATIPANQSLGPSTFQLDHLTPDERRDYARFPNLIRFVKTIKISPNLDTPEGNTHLIQAKKVFQPNQDMWNSFFRAAVDDAATNLRAFAIIAREIKERGVTVYGPGVDFEAAIERNQINLGLSLPAKNIGLGIWEPLPNEDPEYQLSLTVIYKERYIHQFPDEVLPANLKIGYGDEVQYETDGKLDHGYLLKADVYYGSHGIGFKNVHGVGGQKRGLLGFFQKVLFFLPDAIHSMVIDEQSNSMITEALINTVVKDFETRDIYRIRKQL